MMYLLPEMINEVLFAFDIGANIGRSTFQFLEQGWRVLVVEPQDDLEVVYDKEHGLIVDVLHIGVADKPGTKVLDICRAANTVSTFSEEWKTTRFSGYTWDVEKEVEIRTLDNLMEEYGIPDYVKIDVEGYELQVLKGLSYKVPYISIEYMYEIYPKTLQCIHRLKEIGMKQTRVMSKVSPSDWMDIDDTGDYLLTIENEKDYGDIYAK